jgi:hypothetical protein
MIQLIRGVPPNFNFFFSLLQQAHLIGLSPKTTETVEASQNRSFY